jgi:hypothetical protein
VGVVVVNSGDSLAANPTVNLAYDAAKLLKKYWR